MIQADDPASAEAAKFAARAELEQESRKQPVSGFDAVDMAGNVMVEGVGQVVGKVIGAAAEGVATVLAATGKTTSAVIGGVFDNLGP
jgi:hypothetical protein